MNERKPRVGKFLASALRQMAHHLHSDYKLPSLLTESTTSLGTKWLQYELSQQPQALLRKWVRDPLAGIPRMK
jgi:hypothetical protein